MAKNAPENIFHLNTWKEFMDAVDGLYTEYSRVEKILFRGQSDSE